MRLTRTTPQPRSGRRPPPCSAAWAPQTRVAAATVFLASDRASFITGQTLFVDGGLTIVDATVRHTMALPREAEQWS